MIRSRIANVAILLVGFAFTAFFVITTTDLLRRGHWRSVFDPSFLFFLAVPFGLGGLWLLFGAANNLRRLARTPARELPPTDGPLVRVLLLITLLGVLLVIAAVPISSYINSSLPFVLLAAGMCTIIGSVCVLLIHFVIRGQ